MRDAILETVRIEKFFPLTEKNHNELPNEITFFKNFFVLVLLSCYSFISAQYNVPVPPSKIYPVYDKSRITECYGNRRNQQKLIKFADSSSTEILVVIIPTTNGEDVNFASATQWEKWKIGRKKTR